jgi:hypothetical protein
MIGGLFADNFISAGFYQPAQRGKGFFPGPT